MNDEKSEHRRKNVFARRFRILFLLPASLAKEVALKTAVWAVIIMLALTGAAYVYLFKNSEARTLENLKIYVAARVESERFLFDLARDNMRAFADEFLETYLSDTVFSEEEFESFFFRDEHGAVRLRPEYFSGAEHTKGLRFKGVSAFIGNSQKELSQEFKRRLVLSYFLVARLGPAWVNRFANLHVSMPENALLIYWPETAWGLDARPDLVMTDGAVIKATLQQFNPQRKPVWTGLYYDLTANHWMITYQHPLDHEGRHLLSASLDVYLDDLMNRMVARHIESSYNFIVSLDGKLVAHPERLHQAKEQKGVLDIEKLEDPALSRMYEILSASAGGMGEEPLVLYDERGENYLATMKIPGPEWLFVSVYPKSLLLERAHESARLILVLGALFFFSFMAVVVLVLRKSVAEPVGVLRRASEGISEGDYSLLSNGEFETMAGAPNEVGLLGRAFREMARSIRDANRLLEEKIAVRTSELAAANKQLEELSLLDPLTRAFNRRAFDRDMERAFDQAQRGKGSFALMLCDVDFFKLYNDTYGHEAGDRALQRITEAMTASVRPDDRVYRYGGEEIMLLFNAPYPGKAKEIAERVLEAVRSLKMEHSACPWGTLTVSAGLEEYSSTHESSVSMIREVDRKLYMAKNQGRNRLVV